ncbi:hypothetical protein QE152_g40121 [Popillia japonica]|uniref:Uncharacterized protein n=1 Tax=Popillia japonica TaxID=7064 RepID=A0AAW1HSG1_POPJA
MRRSRKPLERTDETSEIEHPDQREVTFDEILQTTPNYTTQNPHPFRANSFHNRAVNTPNLPRSNVTPMEVDPSASGIRIKPPANQATTMRKPLMGFSNDTSLTGSRDDLDPDRYYVDSFELPYCEIDILEPDYYQNIQSEELYDQTSNCVANFEEIQLNSNGCVKYLPYIVVPELDNAKLLIDTGATDSIINPDLADLYFTEYIVNHPFTIVTMHGTTYHSRIDLYFTEYIVNHPFTIVTMHGTTYHSRIAITPGLASFKSSVNGFRWNVAKFSEKFQGLIGSTMLMKLNAQIDYKNNMIHLPTVSIPFFYDLPTQNANNSISDPRISDILNKNVKEKLQDDHLNVEEKSALRKLVYEYKDILHDEAISLTFTSKIQHDFFNLH